MKIWLSGANGQLGWEIKQMTKSMPGIEVVALGRDQLDITDQNGVARSLQSTTPDIVVNAAAYTAVDQAEKEAEQAFAVNRDAPGYIAHCCSDMGIPMIHISTDYVFDGEKTEPYVETDPVNPINVYGQSKLEGEQAVIERLQQHVILRTSWVFGRHGNNFVKTMIRLFRENKVLKVVDDQFGCPTYTGHLSSAVVTACESLSENVSHVNTGIFHYCDIPKTCWYEFAKSIYVLIDDRNSSTEIIGIPSTEYPVAAVRPKYSVLNSKKFSSTLRFSLRNWKDGVGKVIDYISDEYV